MMRWFKIFERSELQDREAAPGLSAEAPIRREGGRRRKSIPQVAAAKKINIAVGIAVASDPPRRSVREELHSYGSCLESDAK